MSQAFQKAVQNRLVRYGFAIALPPVGVFLTYGFRPALLVNVPLTLLGWLPGSIHAVWAIAKYEQKQGEAQGKAEGNPTGDSLQANA